MELLAHLAGAFAVAALLVHVATSSVRRLALPPRHRVPQRARQRAPVTIIRPLCGLDAYRGGDAALHLRAGLSATRDPAVLRLGRRSRRAAGRAADRRASARAGAPADRRRARLRQPQAQQRRQGLARRQPRLDRHHRQQRADAARLRASPARRLAARHRPRLARRRSARGRPTPGPSWNAPSSTPTRRAGSTPPTASASASRRARRCSGGASTWSAPAASTRSAPSWPRTPPRPRWCASRACACAWSTAPSRSRSGFARCRACGRASCAGRGCGVRPSRSSIALEIFSGLFAPLAACVFAAWCLDLPELPTARPVRRHLARLRVRPGRHRRLAAVVARAAAVAAARSAAARAVGAVLARQRPELARQRHERRRPRLQRPHRLAPPRLRGALSSRPERSSEPGPGRRATALRRFSAAGAAGSAMRGSLRARLNSATARGAEKPRIATCSSVSPSRSTPASSSTSALTISWHCFSLVSASSGWRR